MRIIYIELNNILSLNIFTFHKKIIEISSYREIQFFKLKESINPCVLYNEVSELTQVCEYGLLYFYLALMLSNKSSIYNNANFYSGIIRNYVIQIHTFCNFLKNIPNSIRPWMRGGDRFLASKFGDSTKILPKNVA